jgi:hypothetical protein
MTEIPSAPLKGARDRVLPFLWTAARTFTWRPCMTAAGDSCSRELYVLMYPTNRRMFASPVRD